VSRIWQLIPYFTYNFHSGVSMKDDKKDIPFKIGDRVEFSPDKKTIGWTSSSFDRLRIHPGDIGIVTKIVDNAIFIDDDRGGLSWECFRLVK